MKNHNCGASYSVVGNSRAKHLRGNGRLLCARGGHHNAIFNQQLASQLVMLVSCQRCRPRPLPAGSWTIDTQVTVVSMD